MVSIHASVKDATTFAVKTYYYTYVSIHASVKDATFTAMSYFILMGFNPRICKRCDVVLYHYYKIFKVSIHASVKDATHPSV